MKVKHLIYKSLLAIYNFLPAKQILCEIIRATGLPREKFYKDLKFEGNFTVKVLDKTFILRHHKSTIENEIFWYGLGNTWESDTIWAWQRLVPTSKVIFDIGANTGVYSLLAKTIKSETEVHAFEPVERTFQWLKHNTALNKFDVVLNQVALSDKSGKQIFYDTDFLNQTSASLHPDKLKNLSWYTGKVIEYEVTVSRLDDYMEFNQINSVDLLKIDVEMYEPQVIKGFAKGLTKHRPLIFIEVLNEDIAGALNNLFADLSYTYFHLSGKNTLQSVSQLSCVPHLWNFLLCPKERETEIRDLLQH